MLSSGTSRKTRNYRLQYEVGESRVLVVAFLHGARDFAAWKLSQDQE